MRSTKKGGPGIRAQRGQTFLIMVLLIAVGAGALLYNLVSPGRIAIERDTQTAAALAQAKDALIGFAAGLQYSGTERPGNLPCPDISGFGSQGNFCNSDGVRIGRLPWKSLGLPELRDGHGEPLWYAVSDNFKKSTATGILNIDTPGNLTVTGSTPATNVIAIVFAPGPVVGGQDRNSTATSFCETTKTSIKNHLCPTNYLEGGNEIAGTTFVTGPTTAIFNDKLLLITSDNLFSAVEMRVAREARTVLQTFYNNNLFFPFANSYGDGSYQCTNNQLSGRIPRYLTPNCKLDPLDADWKGVSWPYWFFPNNWHHVLFYVVASKCADPISPACAASGGMLTVNTMAAPNNNNRALIITPGRAFAGQARPCAAVTDCMEDAENTNGDSTYTASAVTPTVNDRLVVVSP
jgi:hypothetical protein